jgi:hypothetical protein
MSTKLLVLGLCAVLIPQAAAGQQNDSERCRRWVAAVQGNTVAAERAQAVRSLSVCGSQGGVVLAAELKRLRDESDTGTLMKVYAPMAELRDASILEAALDVAGDRSAAETARIIAFKVLIAYHRGPGNSLPVSHFLPGNLPSLTNVYDATQLEGVPLPRGWQDGATSLLERIAADPAEGKTMPHAARRALMFFAVRP